MEKETPRLYEGMYLLNSGLSEEARKGALEHLQNEIAACGGEIQKIHERGRQRLAYQINGRREGYYYIIYFSVRPSAIMELWREYHLNENLMRFLTLRVEKVQESIEFKKMAENA